MEHVPAPQTRTIEALTQPLFGCQHVAYPVACRVRTYQILQYLPQTCLQSLEKLTLTSALLASTFAILEADNALRLSSVTSCIDACALRAVKNASPTTSSQCRGGAGVSVAPAEFHV